DRLGRTRCPARPVSWGRLVCLDQGLNSGVAGGPDSNSSRDKLCSALSGCFKLSGSGGLSGHAGGCKCCDFAAQPEIASEKISSASLSFTFDSLLFCRLRRLDLSDPFDCPALGLAGLGLRLSLGLGKLPDDPLGPH